MPPWVSSAIEIGIALFLVALNGFFVAAEFALVKVRPSRIDEFIEAGRPFAKSAKWLIDRMEQALSACQLGITMASLAIGWVGEPVFEELLSPAFHFLSIPEAAVHTLSVIFAFTIITALHLVIGEQAPKIFAIRRAEDMLLWCALPMKLFYICGWPLMAALNWVTTVILSKLGLEGGEGHDTIHTETELQTLLASSYEHGHLSRSEHKLIEAVFRFDDLVCRRVMVPRNDVEFFDINDPPSSCVELARRTKHTRYPVCNDSLDEVLGVVHMKDLIGFAVTDDFDWTSIMRPPKKVPESMPISKLLKHFQATHQLLAFVIDEYGNVIGIVTLENVLEEIIGEVDDEFDNDDPHIIPDGPDQFILRGRTPLEEVCEKFDLESPDAEIDTFAGLLVHKAQRILSVGDRIELDDWTAEVLEVRDNRARRIRMSRSQINEDPAEQSSETPDQPPTA
ncbi:MAG: CBS domain containing-hemolysin-like protein [Planctomycetaceae bacterium]|jgi:CBS domain containing-hemolysin-like protein